MNYLLLGPEEGEKGEWLDNEKKRILKEHPDAEIHSFYCGDDTGDAVSSVLSQASLFSSFRYVVIKQYENRGARDGITDAILSFLRSGQDDAELVIVSSERSSAKIPKAVLDAIGAEHTIMFWEMFENKKRDWIRNSFRKEGFSISEEAVDEVLFIAENNTAEMKNLVTSISLYYLSSEKGKKSIGIDDISAFAVKTRGEDGNTLFQAIAERDIERALLIMKTIRETDNSATIRAFSVLTAKFRMLESCLELKEKRLSEKEIFQQAVPFSSYPGAFVQKGVRNREAPAFRKAMQNYTLDDVRAIILYLGKMDSEIKNAQSGIGEILISQVIYTIIILKGRSGGISLTDSPLDIGIIRN